MGNRIYISLDENYIRNKLESDKDIYDGMVEFEIKNLDLEEEYVDKKYDKVVVTLVDDKSYISVSRDLKIGFLTEIIEYIKDKLNKFKSGLWIH